MREKLKKIQFVYRIIRNIKIKNKVKQEYLEFKNNWMYSKPTINKIGYEILLESHALEKGMTNIKPRPFGKSKVDVLIKDLNLYLYNNWDKDYAYKIGISILNEYINFYKNKGWINCDEYNKCKSFLKDKKIEIKTGTKIIQRKDIIVDDDTSYCKILKSRYSMRQFEEKKISEDDLREIMELVLLTPTACNRQMCKIYYINNEMKRTQILKYAHGLTGFDKNSVNMFIITYDISSLCDPGEITQGMFNSGLVALNFVNLLHTKGIGSCFLEYNNTKKEDSELKDILSIPQNEKIAVFIAAGYYKEKNIIPCSTRKNVDDIFIKI